MNIHSINVLLGGRCAENAYSGIANIGQRAEMEIPERFVECILVCQINSVQGEVTDVLVKHFSNVFALL